MYQKSLSLLVGTLALLFVACDGEEIAPLLPEVRAALPYAGGERLVFSDNEGRTFNCRVVRNNQTSLPVNDPDRSLLRFDVASAEVFPSFRFTVRAEGGLPDIAYQVESYGVADIFVDFTGIVSTDESGTNPFVPQFRQTFYADTILNGVVYENVIRSETDAPGSSDAEVILFNATEGLLGVEYNDGRTITLGTE